MPTREQIERGAARGRRGAAAAEGRLMIDDVIPDYYAKRPKSCMGGWGRQFLNISPAGQGAALPRGGDDHGSGLRSVRRTSRWRISGGTREAFNRFRGTDWMPETCRTCDRREIDWGGCRCQAFAITGTAVAADPACGLSSAHQELVGNCRDGVGGTDRHFRLSSRRRCERQTAERGGAAALIRLDQVPT